jgi:hypothetical protein
VGKINGLRGRIICKFCSGKGRVNANRIQYGNRVSGSLSSPTPVIEEPDLILREEDEFQHSRTSRIKTLWEY